MRALERALLAWSAGRDWRATALAPGLLPPAFTEFYLLESV
jgi:hypothetical protein